PASATTIMRGAQLSGVALDGGPVMLEIFGSVLFDLMLLQEAVELVTGGDAEKGAELVTGNAPFTIGFDAKSLQSSASRVLAGRGESGGQFVGDFERDPHEYSVSQLAKS